LFLVSLRRNYQLNRVLLWLSYSSLFWYNIWLSFPKFAQKSMELLRLTYSSLFLIWVIFVPYSALQYYLNASWRWRLWIEANERYGCCQEEMGSSGIFNFVPKITAFLSVRKLITDVVLLAESNLCCTLVLKDCNILLQANYGFNK
jgi:hypothetical protein